MLEEEAAAQANTSGSDDEEMKNPPNKVAEELGLQFQWEGPNVNERANCNGAEANEDVDMDVPDSNLNQSVMCTTIVLYSNIRYVIIQVF